MTKNLLEKLKESLGAVLPILVIVLGLHFAIAPLPAATLALMLAGSLMLIIGLTLFALGTDMAMMPMGEHVGSSLLASRNLRLLVAILFVFGFIVTAAEPDLQVFAGQVASIPSGLLVVGISLGVGLFLVLATLRILFQWRLSYLLMILYGITFLLAIFGADYLAVAFDASAVTTGPITVPFLLAIGAGFASISGNRNSDEDNFGICAVCSVGPIIALLILGMFSNPSSNTYQMTAGQAHGGAVRQLLGGLGHTLVGVIYVIGPILVIFLIFQVVRLRLSKSELVKIFVGLGYLLCGLTVFLTGVNEGFMPAATALGKSMGGLNYNWVLVPLCIIVGACVVVAEPAVHVLTKQVEEITSGAIPRNMMLFGMAAGVGLALSLSMARMLLGLSIWWVMLPGYTIALALTFFVPPIFVGIGFDSGGVAAGAMSAAFVLPFTVGVCQAIGGNVVLDAFGVVGTVAMMPPMTVQIMGVIYQNKLRKADKLEADELEHDAAEVESETTQ